MVALIMSFLSLSIELYAASISAAAQVISGYVVAASTAESVVVPPITSLINSTLACISAASVALAGVPSVVCNSVLPLWAVTALSCTI